MYNRLIIPLLAASALAFACGPRSHSAAESPGPAAGAAAASAATAGATGDSAAPVVGTLELRTGRRIEFALHVVNASDRRVELDFPSGRTHDVAILDAAGREVWRWSEGRLFTQAVQNRLLGAGEQVTYAEQWTPELPAGSYTAVAELHSSNHPVEVRQGFAIR